jgi:hypothetical protein
VAEHAVGHGVGLAHVPADEQVERRGIAGLDPHDGLGLLGVRGLGCDRIRTPAVAHGRVGLNRHPSER